MRNNTINAIMLGENFFEAAAFSSKKGKLHQDAFAGDFLDISQREAASKVIKSACHGKAKINFKKTFSVVIPRAYATIKSLELPSVNANEIARMVDFQLQDSLPYRREDLIAQNLIYPSEQEGCSRIKAIVVQRELIDNLVGILSLASVKISGIDLSSNVLLTRFKMLYKKEPFFDETSLLASIENHSVDFVFIEKGAMFLSRGVVLEGDGFRENFLKEIEKSISLFNHKFLDKILSNIVLWGRRDDLSSLENLVSSQASLKVHVKDDENLLKSSAYAFCERDKDNSINLLPQDIREKQARHLRRISFAKMAFWAALAAVFLMAGFFFDFKEKENRLEAMNQQLEKIKPDAVKIQQEKIITEKALDRQSEPIRSLEVLAELYSITGPGIFFNALSLTDDKSIIKGQAEELDKILEFVSRVEASPLFENVELKYTSKRRFEKKEIVDFEIAFSISKQP